MSDLAIAQDPRLVECLESFKAVGVEGAEIFQQCVQDPDLRPESDPTPPPIPQPTLPSVTPEPTIEPTPAPPSPTPEPTPVPTPSPSPANESTPSPAESPADSGSVADLTGDWILASEWFEGHPDSTNRCRLARIGTRRTPITIMQEEDIFRITSGLKDLLGFRNIDAASGGAYNRTGIYMSEGTVLGNTIKSSNSGGRGYPIVEAEGTISEDGNTITGTATCGSSTDVVEFVLTRQ